MIFVDTSAWFAWSIASDPNHAAAAKWMHANHEPLLITDYIADETLTLLRSRGEYHRALSMGEEFFKRGIATIHYLTPADIRATREIFHRFSDKAWSFTDCSSKLAIEKLGLETAFAFDQHFQQFGAAQVAP